MDLIPLDVLKLIFDKLEKTNERQSFRVVCRKWDKVFLQNSVKVRCKAENILLLKKVRGWRKLEISTKDVPSALVALKPFSSFIVELSVLGPSMDGRSALTFFESYCPNLKRIKRFPWRRNDQDTAEFVGELLSKYDAEASITWWTNATLATIQHPLVHFTNVGGGTFDLVWNHVLEKFGKNLTSVCLELVHDAEEALSQHVSHLKKLHLLFYDYNEVYLEQILTNNSETLVELALEQRDNVPSYGDVQFCTYEVLLNCIEEHGFPNLEKLQLVSRSIFSLQRIDEAEFLRAVRRLPKLKVAWIPYLEQGEQSKRLKHY